MKKIDLRENHQEFVGKRLGWGAKSGLGNPGVQALGAHSEQLE